MRPLALVSARFFFNDTATTEIYTDTMTASTPSFGMPVVAASPRVAAVCAQ
jgi:hypothetical protein